MEPEYPVAAEVPGAFGSKDPVIGAGAGAKSEEEEITVMASFIPFPQWPETPQMYHLVPGVARVIMSFPLVRRLANFGATHCRKSSVVFSLKTL